jgi:hypothetical protein
MTKKAYSRLPRNTSGDYHDISTLERFREAVIFRQIAFHFRGRGDMRKIGSYSRGIDDIIEAELRDHTGQTKSSRIIPTHLSNQRVALQKQGKGLADTT